MAKSFWLMKSEPDVFSWEKLVKDGRAMWDGVRNYTARNNMRAMSVGDLAFFYHSNIGKEVVGVMKIDKEHYPDPTANGADFSVVEVVPVKGLKSPVGLHSVKAEPRLSEMALVRSSRLSVQPVTREEFALILEMSGTKLRY